VLGRQVDDVPVQASHLDTDRVARHHYGPLFALQLPALNGAYAHAERGRLAQHRLDYVPLLASWRKGGEDDPWPTFLHLNRRCPHI
jgi:hypothetical protein